MSPAGGAGRAAAALAGWLALAPALAADAPFGVLDAVRLALARNPGVQFQRKQVELSQGLAEQAAAGFDTRLQAGLARSREARLLGAGEAARATPGTPDPILADTLTGSLGLSRTLRNGVSVTPAVSVAASADSASRALFADPQANRGTLSFSITVPLLRNPGRDSLGAGERAARIEVEASRRDLHHSVAQATLNVASAYWNLLGAVRAAAIAAEAEQAAEQLTGEIRKLIAAGEVPAADLNVVLASLADKRVARSAADQAVHDARNVLARAIGLERAEALVLPPPDEPFPGPAAPAPEALAAWLADGLAARADLAAAALRNQAGRVLLEGSGRSLRPQLDVTVGLRWQGLAEGAGLGDVLNAPLRRSYGPVLSAALVYEFPVENSAARGLLTQRAASLDQGLIRERELRQSIGTNIDGLAAALARSAAQVSAAAEAVALYRTTLANEQTKRRLGSATLIDVISVGDRLLAARLNENAQRLAWTLAVARLRFETGRLVVAREAGDDAYDIPHAALTTLPRRGEP